VSTTGAQPDSSETSQSSLSARVITGGAVVVALFGLFRFASTAEYRAEAQTAFLTMTLFVTAMMIAATVAPRIVGHALSAIFGVFAFVGGALTMRGSLPFLLALVLMVTGVIVLTTTFRSYQARSRVAWAFLSSTLGVMAVCTLFGAPKVRNILESTMWHALMLPGLLTVACVALAMVSDEYRDRVTPRR
jgi:hypothetical protein